MRNRFSGVARRRLYLYKNPEDNRNFSTRPQLFSYGAGIFRLREAGAERTGRERAGAAASVEKPNPLPAQNAPASGGRPLRIYWLCRYFPPFAIQQKINLPLKACRNTRELSAAGQRHWNIRNGLKDAQGAGCGRMPSPTRIGLSGTRKVPPCGDCPREFPHSGEIAAPPTRRQKNEPRKRFVFGRRRRVLPISAIKPCRPDGSGSAAT